MGITGIDIWQLTAWALVALVAAIVGWPVLGVGDWLRQRRKGHPPRCPKCWYDMRGTAPGESGGYVCPECGRQIASQRALRRTRRRLWWLASAPLVLAAAWCAASVPDVQARGWWAMAPRFVLFWALPDVQRRPPPPSKGRELNAAEELELRVLREHGEIVPLYWPERLILRNRAIATLSRTDASDWARITAARALVRMDDDAVKSTPEQGMANVILAKVELTYASLQSFRCPGTEFGTIGVRDETLFLFAFERPSRFRFESLDGHPQDMDLTMRKVVWRDGDPVYSWWTLQPEVRTSADTSLPLAGAGRAANFIPDLLGTGEKYQWSPFELISSPQITSGVMWQGRRCFQVTGMQAKVIPLGTVWIDEETYLVLRHDHIDSRINEVVTVTVYQPEVDVPIDVAWFAFNPDRLDESPLQDPGPRPKPEGLPPRRSPYDRLRR